MTIERDRLRIPRLSALLVAAVVVMTMSQSAMAGTALAASVKVHGKCTGPSRWVLAIQPSIGKPLQVKYTVTGSAAGQTWKVFMSDRGAMVYAGTPTTNSKGTFTVTARVKDLLGLDKIAVAANNTATGETCGARASIL